MKRLITFVIVLLFVSSCATQDEKARTQGTLGGGALGAGLGALIGAAAGGGRGAWIGAAAGGLVGAAAGYAYADKVVQRRKELAGREDDLDARIKFARGVNQDTEEYNRHLEEEMKAEEQQIDRLAKQVTDQQKAQQKRNELKQGLAKKVEDSQKQLSLAEQQLADLKQFRAKQTQASGSLDAEISKLEITLSQLKTNTTALASLDQRI